MPTKRARHVLVETDDIADAIDAAAPWYPGETRADILRRLVRLGAARMAEQQDEHPRVVFDRAGGYTGVYTAGYLDDLRNEWNE